MSDITPYRGSAVAAIGRRAGRFSRQAGSEIERVDAGTSVSMARIDAAAEIQVEKVSALAHVGRRAMQDVALLSQIETQLAQAVPHASGRLAAIADFTAAMMTEIVVDTARKLGR